MIVINFSHPLTDNQRARVAELLNTSINREVEVMADFDESKSFADGIEALVRAAESQLLQNGLAPIAWQSERILLVPPSFAPGASILLAYLHGRMGHFPDLIRIRPSTTTTGDRFEVAEIVDLQQDVRKRGRDAR